MTTSNQITPGMTISLAGKLFRVESSVKVTVAKGTPFIKTKLQNLVTNEIIEKNFKTDQVIKGVSLQERQLEFLYLEGKNYLFLDIGKLEHIEVSPDIIGIKSEFLKEGVEVKASFYGETIFSIELPQFLEIMVVSTEDNKDDVPVSDATKVAVLETGAKIGVPPFIEIGDIIKVDTKTNDYIQRV
ncbi:MAG: elongation factor P [Chlamydiales bacterium]|jgi:elongation factor P